MKPQAKSKSPEAKRKLIARTRNAGKGTVARERLPPRGMTKHRHGRLIKRLILEDAAEAAERVCLDALAVIRAAQKFLEKSRDECQRAHAALNKARDALRAHNQKMANSKPRQGWGHSVALRIPAEYLRRIGIKPGNGLETILTVDGGLAVRPANSNRRAFAKALAAAREAMPKGKSVMNELRRGGRY